MTSSCPHTGLARPECHCVHCARELIRSFAPHLVQPPTASAEQAPRG